MGYLEFLQESAERAGSVVSVGLDPVLEKIPLKGETEEVIVKFYKDIKDAMVSDGCLPGAVKPNIAFYEQYGFEGLRALQKVISMFKELKIPVILDSKRGDIGKTSSAYAKSVFDFWKADSVTVAPYMGSDSVKPFLEKGFCYVLCRTSNAGARDLQDLETEGKRVYEKTAEKILEWKAGAVIGATYPEELAKLSGMMKQTPLLIPGVGAQGGSASEIVKILRDNGYELPLARIHSSSGINYAYEEGTDDYASAAVKALKKLNSETS